MIMNECDGCGIMIQERYTLFVDGGAYCEECVKKLFFECDDCGGYFARKNTAAHVRNEGNACSKVYCPGCYSRLKDKDGDWMLVTPGVIGDLPKEPMASIGSIQESRVVGRESLTALAVGVMDVLDTEYGVNTVQSCDDVTATTFLAAPRDTGRMQDASKAHVIIVAHNDVDLVDDVTEAVRKVVNEYGINVVYTHNKDAAMEAAILDNTDDI